MPSGEGGGVPGSTVQLVTVQPSGGKGARPPAGLPRWSARSGGGRLDAPDAIYAKKKNTREKGRNKVRIRAEPCQRHEW